MQKEKAFARQRERKDAALGMSTYIDPQTPRSFLGTFSKTANRTVEEETRKEPPTGAMFDSVVTSRKKPCMKCPKVCRMH